MSNRTTAEIPGCEWIPADPTNYRERPAGQAKPYTMVVIHITDGHADPHGTAEMFQTTKHSTSATAIIGQKGEKIQCVELKYAAQHAHTINGHTVGVEHSCRSPKSFGPHDAGMPPTEALYQSSAEVVAWLLKQQGLPVQRGVTIEGHHKADPHTDHEDCPDGAPWDWDHYLQLVQQEYDKLPMPEVC